MQRFTISFVVCLMCANAVAGVYLPVVDVSGGTVSARAAFGEEIAPQKRVIATNVQKQTSNNAPQKTSKKVVARSAKRVADAKESKIAADVLTPRRPSADLWANNDAPLRMPRMDEISVVRSDALLPEENLNPKPTAIAKQNTAVQKTVMRDAETIAELTALRKEIARLNERQKQTEENMRVARAETQRAPVANKIEPVANVIETEPKQNVVSRKVNVRREIVPMESAPDVAMHSIARVADEPKMVSVDNSMSKLSPNELKKAFKKTYLSENKHLSTYQIDDRYDVASDMTSEIEGFTARHDLSESTDDKIRPLELKITFMNNDSGLSRANYDLLSKTASIVVNNPKRAIQIAIPESATYDKNSRKIAARRLAIVEQVLRDTGVADQRIVPVLSQRDDDVFVLRIISSEMFETLTQQKRNMFGDNVSKKTYKSMSW